MTMTEQESHDKAWQRFKEYHELTEDDREWYEKHSVGLAWLHLKLVYGAIWRKFKDDLKERR